MSKDPQHTTDAIGIFAVCQGLLAAGAFFTEPLGPGRLLAGAAFFAVWYSWRLWREASAHMNTRREPTEGGHA